MLEEINHAMKILLDERISGAPVGDARGLLVGVLSKKDCLRAP
ncbi:CBS domain-containing protein [Nitratireductor luteus]|nr:CBS domain-containing protein [Nitratireductor luteus]